MAVRTPLYNNAGNIQEMSATQIQQIKDFCTLKYFSGNPVELQVDSGNGTIGSITDTRLQAGAMSSTNSSFPPESSTAEPSVVTVTQNNIKQVLATTPTLTPDTGGILYPVYLDTSNDIKAMSLQDMKDTFIHPVIDTLASTDNTSAQAGTYFISTSSTAADGTKQVVSATPVYTDTRADTSAYTAGGIGETLDQPTNIQSYYLHKNIRTSETFTLPLKIRSDNDLQEYPSADFDAMIQNLMVYTALASTDGYTIRYELGTSTADYSKGTGIADTRLNGSGNYQTRQVGDDYRAQEFPNGTPTTINTYYLRLIKA
tara:strand:- start:686 stop:1630 length:945 start_codon:yes stop_codon:yes gene_type:complete